MAWIYSICVQLQEFKFHVKKKWVSPDVEIFKVNKIHNKVGNKYKVVKIMMNWNI